MKLYTFEKLDIGQDGFYDLFQKTIVTNLNITVYGAIGITTEYEGRIDLICKYLYGSADYIEELMALNNIINPWSMKTGDILFYLKMPSDYGTMYQKDEPTNTQKDEILLMNKNKSTKKDSNRLGSPPVIKPDNLKQIDINYVKKKITIINKFK